ncbi:hypothetical protein NESM_000936600 [Novymonas esmeraldas]|uniref:Uncharacterized protein n=1 Tax=Novymonas esmeraldas TaxID=1808958 RepID=A0AAW0F057_9TRYP
MTGAAAGVAFVITSCFAPYPPVQRIRELQPLLAKWSIGAPPRSQHVSEEDYCKGLINRLAVRIAAITQLREMRTSGVSPAASYSVYPGLSHVLNPLVTQSGSISPSAQQRASFGTVSPGTTDASGMRESRVARRSFLAPYSPVMPPPGRDSKGASVVVWQDAVMPFAGHASRSASLEKRLRSASVSTGEEAAAVPTAASNDAHSRRTHSPSVVKSSGSRT